ncbi:hypothetical protein VNI00_009858 [Paramarasmius palmivorus]|uniref:Zn(2)-C6 fungal-type domain-containing protein n=1 Tax=Paramarasmius palmivorus TaxID=297713 RepID=A0AAW0CKD0_9AGAR
MSSASPEASTPPKRKIRVHAKVRSGCRTCKQRRIKCDETEPTCNNCTRRNVPCVWKEKTKKKEDKGKGEEQTNDDKGVEEVQEKALIPSSASSQLLKQPTTLAPLEDTAALQLVHHYTVYSSSSFCSNADFTATCTIAIPRLSFTNPFLLHAMLSSTALHLGRLHPSDDTGTKWLEYASRHRKIAMLHLTNEKLPTSSADTQYIGICFLTLYTISNALNTTPSNIFSLLTAIHNVWSKINSFMYTDQSLGPMQPIARSDAPVPMPSHLERIYVPNDTTIPDSSELEDPEIAEAYKSAVDILLHTFYPLSQTGFEIMSAILWPAFFPKRFCDLLNEKKQRALVLLYHYLVILRRIGEDGCWWACDMGRCADYVYGLVDVEWRVWLASEWIDGGYEESDSSGAVIQRRQRL